MRQRPIKRSFRANPSHRRPLEGDALQRALTRGYPGPPRSMLGACWRYVLMRAKVRLAYRGDFMLNAIGDLLIAGVGVVFLWAVYSHVPDIKGWTFHEVLFIWGMAETTTGLFYVSFQGLWAVNQRYVLQGEMDRVLLRPLDPYLQVIMDNVNLEDLPVAGLGVGMIAVACTGLEPFSWPQWALLPVFIIAGIGVLAGVLTTVGSIGFRILHRGTAVGLIYQGAAFARYPLDVFGPWLQKVLIYVVPFAFTAFLPATWYLGRDDWQAWAFAQPVVGAVVMAVGYGLWMHGLKSYRSPGS